MATQRKRWSLIKWNSYRYTRYWCCLWGRRGASCTESRSRWEIADKRPPQHIFKTSNGWLEGAQAEAGQWYQSRELQQGKRIWWTGDNLLHHSQIAGRWTLTDVSRRFSGALTLMVPLRWRNFSIFHSGSTFRSSASDWKNSWNMSFLWNYYYFFSKSHRTTEKNRFPCWKFFFSVILWTVNVWGKGEPFPNL